MFQLPTDGGIVRVRSELRSLASHALTSADPKSATSHAVASMAIRSPISVLAVGKAAAAMAMGAHSALDRVTHGLVITPYENEEIPEGWRCISASHPVPSATSELAGIAALDLVARAEGTVLVLLSGGASSLMEVPAQGLSIHDLAETTRVLLANAVNIDDMNVVRKHLSSIKGGRLAAASHAATVRTLVVSDVVGNDLAAIGSGPTVGDPSTFSRAVALATPFRDVLPPGVYRHLQEGERGAVDDTPATFEIEVTAQVVLSGRMIADAVATEAQTRGWVARVEEPPLEGQAAEAVGRVLRDARPGLSIFHGETTVKVSGGGLGGRNQHGALAGALRINGDEHRTLMTLATDGVDGPTDAAGAIVDGGTVTRGTAAGLDAGEHLAACNSNPYLMATGDLLVTGPTGTNVADLWMMFTAV